MKIGAVEIDPPVVLAPLAGVTNHAFRAICRELGAGAVWTEMISSCGISYKNKKTRAMFDWTPEESPVAVQLFGADPKMMADAAALVEAAGADIIDINMGCPVPKVRRTRAGAALMEDLELAESIMSAVINRVKIPVTVKTRKGPDSGRTTAVEMAKIAENAGVSAVAVHGRTTAQGYTGRADWGIIEEVKSSVNIPVIASGDVKSPEDLKKVMELTGCDAVMIGRAALGNPWIFAQMAQHLKDGTVPPQPTQAERLELALRHLRMTVEMYGEVRAVKAMRGHMVWYVRGVPGAAKLRNTISGARTLPEMESAMERILIEQQE